MSVGSYSITDLELSATGKNLAGKAFGHEVMEGTMAQSEGGRSPAECAVRIVLIILTL